LNYYKYYTEIEEAFVRRRGKHLILGTLDWDLMRSWEKKGIPLRVVLSGIENVFDGLEKRPQGAKSVRSLSYCKNQVESQYEEWLTNQVGKIAGEGRSKGKVESEADAKSPLFSKRVIDRHIENVIGKIEKSKSKTSGDLRQSLEEVLEILESHKTNYSDQESLEDSLDILETRVDKALFESFDEESLLIIKSEIEKDLVKTRASIGKDAYRETLDLMLHKRLREDLEIPPLSLFYL